MQLCCLERREENASQWARLTRLKNMQKGGERAFVFCVFDFTRKFSKKSELFLYSLQKARGNVGSCFTFKPSQIITVGYQENERILFFFKLQNRCAS